VMCCAGPAPAPPRRWCFVRRAGAFDHLALDLKAERPPRSPPTARVSFPSRCPRPAPPG
jgi:hypothetical protein